LSEGEEKDRRGEAAAMSAVEEEEVEVAEEGEADEGRVFTQGNHMGGDGRAEAGDGDEGERRGFVRFCGRVAVLWPSSFFWHALFCARIRLGLEFEGGEHSPFLAPVFFLFAIHLERNLKDFTYPSRLSR